MRYPSKSQKQEIEILDPDWTGRRNGWPKEPKYEPVYGLSHASERLVEHWGLNDPKLKSYVLRQLRGACGLWHKLKPREARTLALSTRDPGLVCLSVKRGGRFFVLFSWVREWAYLKWRHDRNRKFEPVGW